MKLQPSGGYIVKATMKSAGPDQSGFTSLISSQPVCKASQSAQIMQRGTCLILAFWVSNFYQPIPTFITSEELPWVFPWP